MLMLMETQTAAANTFQLCFPLEEHPEYSQQAAAYGRDEMDKAGPNVVLEIYLSLPKSATLRTGPRRGVACWYLALLKRRPRRSRRLNRQ